MPRRLFGWLGNAGCPSIATVYGVFAVVIGLVLPLVLIPIIRYTGYSEVVEEVAKALVVVFLILRLPTHWGQLTAGVLFGFLFGASENLLYLNQIFQSGDIAVFWERFLWTAPMHAITVLIMVFSGLVHRWWVVAGLIGAVIVHALFNSIVVSILLR